MLITPSTWKPFAKLAATCLVCMLGGCAAVSIMDGEFPGSEKEAPIRTTPYPGLARSKVEASKPQEDPIDPERQKILAARARAELKKQAAAAAASKAAPPSVAPPVESKPPDVVAPVPPAPTPTKVNSASLSVPANAAEIASVSIVEKAPAPAAPSPAAVTHNVSADVAKATSPVVAPASVDIPLTAPEPAIAVTKEVTPPSEMLPPAERWAKWQKDRDALIVALQEEVRARREKDSHDPELVLIEKDLRLLQLTAGDVNSAAEKIDALPLAEQEAFRHLMFGLSTWKSADEMTRPILRNAKIQRSLRDASHELAKSSKLDLRNLTFCEKVDSYGWFSEFPRNTLKPEEQVILYVEVENFAAEAKGKKEFETELQGSYQIFDMSGKMVTERTLPLDRETCRNFRRDYFLAYRIFLPKAILPGKHRLELTVEDLKAAEPAKGSKFGTAVIEFTVAE